MSTKITDEIARRIRVLRGTGLSHEEIARHVNLSRSAIRDFCLRTGVPGRTIKETAPVSGERLDERTPLGGDTCITTEDKPLTVEQVAELFSIDLSQWAAESIRTNQWEGYYKVKERHQKVRLWQTRVTWRRIMASGMEQAILSFVEKHVVPVDSSKIQSRAQGEMEDPQAVCWGLWDAHLGMYAWAPETRNDSDLGIGVQKVRESVDQMVAELRPYPIDRIWMPVGNDFMHFDNARHTTTFGEHFLDTDTRYAKVYEACLLSLCHMIDRALELTNRVEVIYVPGNHDYTTSYTLCIALKQRYRTDDRVVIDAGANPRKYRVFGGTLLGFDHGSECRAQQLAQILSMECKEHWSQATYREVQIGHTHQRRAQEFESLVPTNGVLVRTNPSLCNIDAWHHRQGLIGEPMKSVEAYRYDRVGYRGSHVAWAKI